MVAVATVVAIYAVWLSFSVAAKPAEGANLGAGFAGLGAAASVAAACLGALSNARGGERANDLAAGALVLLLLALMSVALPTLSLIFPEM